MLKSALEASDPSPANSLQWPGQEARQLKCKVLRPRFRKPGTAPAVFSQVNCVALASLFFSLSLRLHICIGRHCQAVSYGPFQLSAPVLYDSL